MSRYHYSMNKTESEFTDQLKKLSCPLALTERQMEQLRAYYANLIDWNSRMNLTTVTVEKEVYTKHFLDSYTLFNCVSRETFREGDKLIDVGTGAGFPGIPLAIAMPEISVTLLDSLGKRVLFLQDTVEKLGLNNVTCIHARAEDLARNPAYREKYNYVVSRAVSNLSTLAEYCVPYLKKGGTFVAYKSEKVKEGSELAEGKKAAALLGATQCSMQEFTLPDTEYYRILLAFRKTGETPRKYPRKAGIPSKEPLR